jgi:hypothetical protein
MFVAGITLRGSFKIVRIVLQKTKIDLTNFIESVDFVGLQIKETKNGFSSHQRGIVSSICVKVCFNLGKEGVF